MTKYFFIALLLFVFFSCNRYNNPTTGEIDFSTDTVFFDTIFTQIGSTTKQLLIYNRTKTPIQLDQIYLAGENSSNFRLNIDGYAQNNVEDIIIDAEDSLYIFVEVTIDPAKDDLLEKDSIIFVSGGNQQKVILHAVGKDVYLFNGQVLKTQTWTADKAYLIYNSILVDTFETLTIEPGAEIYSHRNSYIYVRGTMIADGTIDAPIIFRGDRIDNPDYFGIPGQWGGIVFLPQSKGNYLNYIELTEGFFGIAVDSMISDASPTLLLNNSKIQQCSYTGIYAVNTYIAVLNSIIADCGVNNIGLFLSGIYQFMHCTIENNYSYSVRNSAAVGLQNFYSVDGKPIFGGYLQAFFGNCIINGNQKTEFAANAYDTVNSMSYLLQNCLVKLDLDNYDTTLNVYQNTLFNVEPNYVDAASYDFHLNSDSEIRDKGDYNLVTINSLLLQFDIDGHDRLADNKPDIGAYEYISE